MSEEAFEGWVVLELMGHRKLGGYLKEQEIGGVSMLRIDVPGSALMCRERIVSRWRRSSTARRRCIASRRPRRRSPQRWPTATGPHR